MLKWGTRCFLSNEFYNAREDPNCKDPDGSGPLKKGDGQFYRPSGIAVDKLGYVYVADLDNQNVQKFTKNGEFVMSWGSYCNLATGEGCTDPDESGSLKWSDGQFASPYDIAIDSNEFVYVLETSNGRVQKFTTDGKFVAKLGKTRTFDGLLSFPEAIAVDKRGNVYVAGGNYNRIQKFSTNGTFLMKWGVGGSKLGQLFSPSGIAVSEDGYVYVADTQNNTVQKFTVDGKFISTWGSLCVIRNNFHGCIDPDGIGALQLGDGQFNNPVSITTDSDGNIYVFDGNSRVQKFDSDGRFIAKWGSFCTLFGYSVETYSPIPPPAIPAGEGCVDTDSRGPLEFGDGQFMWRAYIAADPNGYLYVSDPENKRTQKFTLDGKFLAKYGYSGPIATDKDGNVYVVDATAGYVKKFDDSGNVLVNLRLEQFEGPRGIAVDNSGNIYVFDGNLSIVQKYSPVTG